MYDEHFFDVIREGIKRSAVALVPILFETFEPATVIDVGCGEGWWAQAFEECSQWGRGSTCQVMGIDGPGTRSILGDRFMPHDLREPLPTVLWGQFDLAICLEVAEHLPAERADTFIADLCALAPVVVFSAAIPGQGGTGHVNEQWPDYWAHRFAANGYRVSGEFRYAIWEDDRIENWYRQNLLIAVDLERRPQFEQVAEWGRPLRLVHPVLYEARRS
jgi:SAM-dependent methyltransferase